MGQGVDHIDGEIGKALEDPQANRGPCLPAAALLEAVQNAAGLASVQLQHLIALHNLQRVGMKALIGLGAGAAVPGDAPFKEIGDAQRHKGEDQRDPKHPDMDHQHGRNGADAQSQKFDLDGEIHIVGLAQIVHIRCEKVHIVGILAASEPGQVLGKEALDQLIPQAVRHGMPKAVIGVDRQQKYQVAAEGQAQQEQAHLPQAGQLPVNRLAATTSASEITAATQAATHSNTSLEWGKDDFIKAASNPSLYD